jgi:hypothetical protein
MLCLAVCSAVSLDGSPAPMTMKVSPRTAMAPALIRVEIAVEADDDNRMLRVIAESLDFYRASEMQIDGSTGPRVRWIDFRSLPSGTYEISATLSGIRGRRAMSTQVVQVLASASGR